MPVPNLLHPTIITIRPAARTAVDQDNAYREPVQTIGYGDAFTIMGQVELRIGGIEIRNARVGYHVDETGYVLLRRRDMEAAGYEPGIGDMITETSGGTMSGVPLLVFVTRLVHCAHYPLLGWTLARIYFSGRKPGRVL